MIYQKRKYTSLAGVKLYNVVFEKLNIYVETIFTAQCFNSFVLFSGNLGFYDLKLHIDIR